MSHTNWHKTLNGTSHELKLKNSFDLVFKIKINLSDNKLTEISKKCDLCSVYSSTLRS